MILFILGIQSYMNTVANAVNSLQLFTIIFTIWVLISGFCAGWFYMIKKAIAFSDRIFVYETDRNRALCEIFMSFFKGFGRLFVSFFVVVGLVLFIKYLQYSITNFILPAINNKLDYEFVVLISFIVVSYIVYWMLLWVPEILYGAKNPLKALVNSTKKAFITFPKTVKLFIVMWFIFLGVNILFKLLQLNPFLYFFAMLLNYYLIFYTVILVFNYYEKNFLK